MRSVHEHVILVNTKFEVGGGERIESRFFNMVVGIVQGAGAFQHSPI